MREYQRIKGVRSKLSPKENGGNTHGHLQPVSCRKAESGWATVMDIGIMEKEKGNDYIIIGYILGL